MVIKIKQTHTDYEPVSMIPAGGWRAVFAYREGDKFAHAIPLVAFVLAKITETLIYENGEEALDSKNTAVIGYEDNGDGVIDAVEKNANFLGYLSPGASVDEWEEAAKDFCEKRNLGKSKPPNI